MIRCFCAIESHYSFKLCFKFCGYESVHQATPHISEYSMIVYTHGKLETYRRNGGGSITERKRWASISPSALPIYVENQLSHQVAREMAPSRPLVKGDPVIHQVRILPFSVDSPCDALETYVDLFQLESGSERSCSVKCR